MSTLELEHLKHTSSSSNNLSTHSDGSLTLQSLNVTGDLTVDTNTLFVDVSADKVGINNSAPNHELQVNGNSTTASVALKTSATGNTTSDGLELKVQGDSAAYLYNYENAMLRFGTNGLERVRIDANGHVTMPAQPAFLVSNVGQTAQANISANADTVINFGTEVFDQNADFASNVFTAPVSGRYQLNSVLYTENLDTAADYYIMTILTSNRNIFNIIDPGVFASDPVYWTFTSSVLADMDANDTAKVRLTQVAGTAQTDINTHSFFSGYLVA